MRMVRCLCKKFTIRIGIEYHASAFLSALKQLRELAFETLLSGNPLMQKRNVLKRVGDDAFNFGLLINHEDGFLLLKDETADILVTFPHRTIQEFLGAFFFNIYALHRRTFGGFTWNSLLLTDIHGQSPVLTRTPVACPV